MSEEKKLFPVMPDKHAVGPLRIPWSVAEKAFGVYCLKYGRGQDLERLAERGGFYWGELDDLYPQWRTESSEVIALRKALRELHEAATGVLGSYENYCSDKKPEAEWDEYDFGMNPKWKTLRETLERTKDV